MARTATISGVAGCECGQPKCIAVEITGTLFADGNIVQSFQYPAQMAGLAIAGWIASGIIYESRGSNDND